MLWSAHPEVIPAIESALENIAREILALSMARDNTLTLGDNELGFCAKLEKLATLKVGLLKELVTAQQKRELKMKDLDLPIPGVTVEQSVGRNSWVYL